MILGSQTNVAEDSEYFLLVSSYKNVFKLVC